jgi:RND family efflux transporter MFP subunit
MKAITHFVAAAALGSTLAACGSASVEAPPSLQAVRAVEVRVGAVVEGRDYLAEVVPSRTVRVLAQVPGGVSELAVETGERAERGEVLVRVAAPDVEARLDRVRAERGRAEREQSFACQQRDADRTLAQSGDLATVQLDRSETGCAAATLAVSAARAGEREATVAGTRSAEHAPFDGEVLAHLVDVGQTVMPGTPLVQFGSVERQLRLRVPDGDLADIQVGTVVNSPIGSGRVVEIGASAVGPARLVEVLVDLEAQPGQRIGTTTTATAVITERASATSVPLGAVGEDDAGSYIFAVREQAAHRVDVHVGPRQDGWVAIDPPLDPGSLVVASALSTVDPTRPVLVVKP